MGNSGKRKGKRTRKKRRYLTEKPPAKKAATSDVSSLLSTKIGQENSLFVDTNIKTLYRWDLIEPESRNEPQRSSGMVPLLTRICADTVAQNVSQLHPSYLDSSWTVWKHVWLCILERKLDSPAVFGMFVRQFGKEPTFRCHRSDTSSTRLTALQGSLIPSNSKVLHRMENIFSNVSLKDFAHYVSHNLLGLALDMSSRLSRTMDIHLILHFKTLTALDLSYLDMDDLFLKSLSIALDDKLHQLRVLVLHKCPRMSSQAISQLMQLPTNSLDYIECNHRLVEGSEFASHLSVTPTNNPLYVEHTNWKYIGTNILSRLPLGLKTYALHNRHAVPLSTRILYDVMVYDEEYQSPDQMPYTWKERIIRRNQNPNIISYIRDRLHHVNPPTPAVATKTTITTSEPNPPKTIFKVSRKLRPSNDPRTIKRAKPISKKTNVSEFFEI